MKSFIRIKLTLLLVFFAMSATAFAQSDASAIVGSWSDSSVGLTNYENQTTGAWKNGRGSSFSYKFNRNGTFEYVGYMEVTTYNCTTTLYNHQTGKYSIDGSTVTFKPAKDHWKSTNSCAASGNKTQDKTPVEETAEWQVGENEQGRLVLVLDKGRGAMRFRRDEK